MKPTSLFQGKFEMSKKNFFFSAALATGLAFGSMQAQATPFTSTSPTNNFDVTTVGASTIGGVVMDLFGLNGAHVISQLAANSLHLGYSGSNNPFTIGIQTGLTGTVLNALGGGLQAVSFRFTLYDGDTGLNDFDDNQNTLLVNGINFGNWSDVVTQQTDSSGNFINQNNAGGFRDGRLDTGWFSSQDTSKLNSFFTSISTSQQARFQLYDTSPFKVI